MQFFAAILSLAALAMALPGGQSSGTDVTSAQANEMCGNGATVSCCNSGSSKADLITGLNCVSVPILAIPISQQCGNGNQAACCQTDQTGAINLAAECLPIAL